MQLEGSARRFAPVDPKGLKSTTKPAALKAAKQNSSLVAKIKTKIQNTSSFFKVSLKTNNKALALALVAQKDKSRLLETETVRLRKEVQSLCFDLAHHRHQHNRLVRLLKDLQASALHSIVAAVDLLSAEDVQDSSDAPEEINEKSQTDPEDAITELRRVPSRVPVVSEKIGNTPRPSPKKPTRESSGSPKDQLGNPSEEIHSQTSTATLHRVIGQGSTCNEDTETVAESIPPRKEKIARPSSGLQQELDKWSQIYLDIQLEPEPIPEPLAVVNSPPLPEPLPEPASVEPKGTSGGLTGESPGPERTTLFESEMEITLGEPLAEIVAVETKPKKSKKESVAKSQRKEGTPADGARPPDKEEKKKKKKSSSVRWEETPSTDAPPTQGRGQMQSPASYLSLNPVGPALEAEVKEVEPVEREVGPVQREAEPVERDGDLFAARRNVHVTSRNAKNRRQTREAPPGFTGERSARKTYIVSLDTERANSGPLSSPKDDYFGNAETCGAGIGEKGIPWDTDTRDDEEGLRGKSRKTYVVPASQSGCAVNRRTYVISDDGEQGRTSTKSRRTKALSVSREHEPVADGLCVMDPGHTEGPAAGESSVLEHQSGPGLAGKRKGPFTEGPGAPSWDPTRSPVTPDGPIMLENPPWETPLDPPSAVTGEPKPKRCRKESGTRLGKKERKQRDEASSQAKKRKKGSGHKEKDLDANVPTSWGYSGTLTPAPSNHAGPDPRELSAGRPEPCGIVTASVTSHRKNIMRKTNITSDGRCEGSNSVDTTVTSQPIEFPVAEQNIGAIKPVTLAHASADSNCEVKKENYAYSTTTEAEDGVARNDAFWEPNIHLSQEQMATPSHQSCPVANRKTSVVSERHARGPASVKGQRSRVAPRGRDPEAEREVHSGGVLAAPPSPDGTRESLKRLILEERPPWELMDDSCASLPEWDVPLQTQAPSPVSKPTPARVTVYEEPADPAPESSPADRALQSLTNTPVTMDAEHGRVRRRGKGAVSYKEPAINCKMRRGDKFSDTKFLSSPIFKDKKKKKKAHAQKMEIHTRLSFNDTD